MVSKLGATAVSAPATDRNNMAPSLPNLSNPSATFTLSYCGVDFRLMPEVGTSTSGTIPMLSVVSPSEKEKDVVLNLSGFTGTLRVSMSPNSTAKVEEEPSSPVATSSPGGKVSPGQQQLTFVKATAVSKPRNLRSKSGTTKESDSLDSATPNVVPPSVPKKLGGNRQQKRVVPEIAANSTPPASPVKKTKREEAPVETTEDSLSSLGQTPQLSQTAPSQSTGTYAEGDLDGENVSDDSHNMEETTIDRPSTVDQEIVSAAESCSEDNSVKKTSHENDDLSIDSTRSLEKDTVSLEENTIMEVVDDNSGEVVASATSTDMSTTSQSTRKGQPPPSPRWGHTMTMIDGNRILVYGGQMIDTEAATTKTLSDINVFDISKNIWFKPVNCEGVPRQWHTATYLPERQLLISFGGESANPKSGRITTTDQVMVLDTEIMLWYPPTVSGVVPSGRSGHTATLLPNTNELVVFGGVKGHKWQNSVAVLDISRWKWSCPKVSGDAPRPRSYHSATALGGNGHKTRLVIFGGNDKVQSFNSIHVLETDGKKWSWSHPKASGTTVPPPRTGHCATLLEDKKTILVYGGWDPNADDDDNSSDDEMIFEDSYLLDTDKWEWSIGPKPVYAGDGTSSSKMLAQNGGGRRVGHRAVLTNGEDGAQVLVFGGRIPNDQFSNDFQTLTVPQSMVGFGG